MTGAVLCGGASRRMGEPKALVEIDGQPLAGRVAAALAAAGATQVVLVGGEPAWAERLGLALVPDRWPGAGPLGGIVTAVLDTGRAAADPDAIMLVAACDQPWLDPTGLRALVAGLADRPQAGASAPLTADGRVHPLPSAWRARTGERLATLMDSGGRRADAGLGVVTVVEVPFHPDSLTDVDTPEDLADRQDR